jgi:hypothetical protein
VSAPVREISLFRGAASMFERRATVTNSQTIAIPLSEWDTKRAATSLVATDVSGRGAIQSISFGVPLPPPLPLPLPPPSLPPCSAALCPPSLPCSLPCAACQ